MSIVGVTQGDFADERRRVFAVRSFMGICLTAFVLPMSGCGSSQPQHTESTNHFIEAQKAIAEGDASKAIASLTASVEASPSVWAYFERAKLQLKNGDEQAALADCQAGLEIDPKSPDINWLQGEIKKPEAQRFKGRFANPPSLVK